jgi:Holliday junction resolvasome RuvABC endonuclease subunit
VVKREERDSSKKRLKEIWYIGLDQALSNTGIALFNGKTILTTVLKTSSSRSPEERLSAIDNYIDSLLKNLEPYIVLIEESYPGAHRTSAMRLAQVYCTVTNACIRNNIRYKVYRSGKGKESWPGRLGIEGTKEHCREWLKRYKGEEEVKQLKEHEIDAIGILWANIIEVQEYILDKIPITPIKADDISKYYRETVRESPATRK